MCSKPLFFQRPTRGFEPVGRGFLWKILWICIFIVRRKYSCDSEHIPGVSLASYMTEGFANVHASHAIVLAVEGRDLKDLLYSYLDEILFQFVTNGFVSR